MPNVPRSFVVLIAYPIPRQVGQIVSLLSTEHTNISMVPALGLEHWNSAQSCWSKGVRPIVLHQFIAFWTLLSKPAARALASKVFQKVRKKL